MAVGANDTKPVTLVTSNSVAAPTSGATFCGFGSPPPVGFYDVEIIYTITGAVETQPLNVRLTVNGVTYVTLPSGAGTAGIYKFNFKRVFLDGVNNPALKANAAGTASTVYSATIAVSQLFP